MFVKISQENNLRPMTSQKLAGKEIINCWVTIAFTILVRMVRDEEASVTGK